MPIVGFMGRVDLRRDLEPMVAARFLAPQVTAILQELRDDAARRAPDAHAWLTYEDERVRSSHRKTHGQTIPGNLRFQLPQTVYLPGGGSIESDTRVDLAREPRDPSLPDHQSANCRCEMVVLPGVVGGSIRTSPVVVSGGRASGEIYTRFPRAEESEFGTDDGEDGDEAAAFMRGALAVALARTRR